MLAVVNCALTEVVGMVTVVNYMVIMVDYMVTEVIGMVTFVRAWQLW